MARRKGVLAVFGDVQKRSNDGLEGADLGRHHRTLHFSKRCLTSQPRSRRDQAKRHSSVQGTLF